MAALRLILLECSRYQTSISYYLIFECFLNYIWILFEFYLTSIWILFEFYVWLLTSVWHQTLLFGWILSRIKHISNSYLLISYGFILILIWIVMYLKCSFHFYDLILLRTFQISIFYICNIDVIDLLRSWHISNISFLWIILWIIWHIEYFLRTSIHEMFFLLFHYAL